MSDTGNFADALREHARALPDLDALVVAADGPRTATKQWARIPYAELDRRVDRLAAGFRRVGVREGDRVLFLVRPSIDFYSSLLALMRIGAVPILIDPGMGLRRVLDCIAEIRPRVAVALPVVRLIRTLAPASFRSVELFITAGSGWLFGGPTLGDCLADASLIEDSIPRKPQDEALIAFTSGSTGPAKGVSFTHGMFATQSKMLGEAYGWQPGQKMVMCFAAFVLYTLARGMTAVLPAMDLSKPAKARPERIAEAANEHQADFAFASPIVWMNVVRHAPRLGLRFPTLRQVITTGAPIASELHEALLALLPEGAELLTPYGATEALPVSTVGSAEILAETAAVSRSGFGTCVGRPFAGVDVHVIRVTDEPIEEWSEALEVPAGEVGEIVVGGDVVSPEYKERPDANAASKVRCDGRLLHRMGDLGYLDESGRLWFCGRKSERLETARGVIAPVLVENVFDRHPQVFRSALVGLGPRGKQSPVLCVEMEKGSRFTPAVEKELRELASSTRWDGVVQAFLAHPGFPVDARHNTKIRRCDLEAWATRQHGPIGSQPEREQA